MPDRLIGRAAALYARRLAQQLVGPAVGERVLATMSWVEHMPNSDEPLISVITPTHERPEYLARAIESVIGQSHRTLEHIVIEDGGPGPAQEVVRRFDDSRLRYSSIPKQNQAAARNLGLHVARGQIVAYLDDDNVMDRQWLKAVAWALTRRPDVQLLYGATIKERAADGSTYIVLPRFDPRQIRRTNQLDIGMLAHRSGLRQATFDVDPALQGFEDWEFAVRMTRTYPPHRVFAVAQYYYQSAPDRAMARADVPARYARAKALIAKIPSQPGGSRPGQP